MDWQVDRPILTAHACRFLWKSVSLPKATYIRRAANDDVWMERIIVLGIVGECC